MNDHNTLLIKIDSLASGGGDGVGRSEGMAVFVPRTAPGDSVKVKVVHKQKRFARARLQSIVEPSSDRIDPVCKHYTEDHCGGCQLQHIRYPAQLLSKRNMVVDAMRRIGKREVDSLLTEVQPSPKPWRYRTKLTLAMERVGRSWIAGLHPYDAPAEIFNLEDCPITDERVVAVWGEILDAGDCLPDVRKLRGSVRWTEDGPIFVLIGAEEWSDHAANALFKAVPKLAALYWEPVGESRRLMADRRTAAVPAASFAQVNPTVASELIEYVKQIVSEIKPSKVIEGYSGNGDLAVHMTRAGIRVTAIELDEDASNWAQKQLVAIPENVQPDGSRSIAVNGKVERLLSDSLPCDLLIVNPPRSGLHEEIPEIIGATGRPPKSIIYVSCDPATLARDIYRFTNYEIQSLKSFDMFPQTSHVETVCELRLKPPSKESFITEELV